MLQLGISTGTAMTAVVLTVSAALYGWLSMMLYNHYICLLLDTGNGKRTMLRMRGHSSSW